MQINKQRTSDACGSFLSCQSTITLCTSGSLGSSLSRFSLMDGGTNSGKRGFFIKSLPGLLLWLAKGLHFSPVILWARGLLEALTGCGC